MDQWYTPTSIVQWEIFTGKHFVFLGCAEQGKFSAVEISPFPLGAKFNPWRCVWLLPYLRFCWLWSRSSSFTFWPSSLTSQLPSCAGNGHIHAFNHMQTATKMKKETQLDQGTHCGAAQPACSTAKMSLALARQLHTCVGSCSRTREINIFDS